MFTTCVTAAVPGHPCFSRTLDRLRERLTDGMVGLRRRGAVGAVAATMPMTHDRQYRYTHAVRSWKRQVLSVLVLVTLAGLPVASAVCAFVCDSAGAASSRDASPMAHQHHHMSGQVSPEAVSAIQSPIGSAFDHDCCADAGVLLQGELAATPSRGDASVGPLAESPVASQATSRNLTALRTLQDSGPAPSPTPSAHLSLVLRI